MNERTARPTTLTILLCTATLALAGLTGCERSESDSGASAEANAPTSAEQAGSPTETDETDSPTETDQAGSETAGAAANEQADQNAQKPGSLKKKPAPSDGMKAGDKAESGDEITDAELKKFIEVSQKLRPKQAEMKKALKNAESKSEAREAQKMIMKETKEAVEASGLSFERFRTISQRAKSDKQLQMKLRKMAMEQQQGGK